MEDIEKEIERLAKLFAVQHTCKIWFGDKELLPCQYCDIKKDLTNLIHKACNQARIDELEMIEKPDEIFSRSIPAPILFALKKRIKELKELNNEL